MSRADRIARAQSFTTAREFWQDTNRRLGRYVFTAGSLAGGLAGWAIGNDLAGVVLGVVLAVLWGVAMLAGAWHVWHTGSWVWGVIASVATLLTMVVSPVAGGVAFGLYLLFVATTGGIVWWMRQKALRLDGAS